MQAKVTSIQTDFISKGGNISVQFIDETLRQGNLVLGYTPKPGHHAHDEAAIKATVKAMLLAAAHAL